MVNFDPVKKKNENKLNWNTESFPLIQDSGFLMNVQHNSEGCKGISEMVSGTLQTEPTSGQSLLFMFVFSGMYCVSHSIGP